MQHGELQKKGKNPRRRAATDRGLYVGGDESHVPTLTMMPGRAGLA